MIIHILQMRNLGTEKLINLPMVTEQWEGI